MKMKTRLIISFCIIIFVPASLACLTLLGFVHMQAEDFRKTYGVEKVDYSYMVNSVHLLNRITKRMYQELEETASDDPDKLADTTYLSQMNARLLEKNSYMIVKKNGEIIFAGAEEGTEMPAVLPDYGEMKLNNERGYLVDGERQELIKALGFDFTDGSPGSLYIITSAECLVPEIREFIVDVVISVILILLFTAAMLTIWIYRSMLNPIKKLQTAMQTIKEGNLDVALEIDSKDEIGEL